MSLTLDLSPGFHENIAAADYHADILCDVPTLSSSVAKIILSATPRHAWTAHPRLNPNFQRSDDDKFDLGSVVHELILGRGAGFSILDFEDYRSKAAKEARDAARAAGTTPILFTQFDRAALVKESILANVRAIPGLEQIFAPDKGRSETVLIWNDPGGARCRAMLDWQGPTEPEIWDVKTTAAGLSDEQIARTIVNVGHDLSAGFYLRGLNALKPELAGRWTFRWVFVETDEPYEARVVEADPMTLSMGDRKAALAIEYWRRALAAREWPGYPKQISHIEYPAWAHNQWMAREMVDDTMLAAHVSDHAVSKIAERSVNYLAAG